MPAQDRSAAQARVQANLQSFQAEFFNSQMWDTLAWLNFDSLKRKMSDAISGGVTKTEAKGLWARRRFVQVDAQTTNGLDPIAVKLRLSLEIPKKASASPIKNFST